MPEPVSADVADREGHLSLGDRKCVIPVATDARLPFGGAIRKLKSMRGCDESDWGATLAEGLEATRCSCSYSRELSMASAARCASSSAISTASSVRRDAGSILTRCNVPRVRPRATIGTIRAVPKPTAS